MTHNKTIFILFFLTIASLKVFSQTRLFLFTENGEYFTVSLNKEISNEKVSNFFVLDNIRNTEQNLHILINNSELNKSISLKPEDQSVYAIVKEKGEYKIRYRGIFDEDSHLYNFINNRDKAYLRNNTPLRLIPLNNLLNSIDQISAPSIKREMIINRLSNGNYNCRQLQELFTKVENDKDKLLIFEQTNHNCLDPQNFEILTDSFSQEEYSELFKETAIKNLNQF